MKYKLITILLSLLYINLSAKTDNTQKQILILHSYNRTMSWVTNIDKAINDTLKPNKNSYIFHTEYMDTKRIFTKEYISNLKKLYKLKYKHTKFDLILSSDNNAFDFLRKNRDSLFGDIPVVFCGVNFFKESDLKGYKNYTGVAEQFAALRTIDTATKLYPQAKNIFVINDYLTTGRAWDKTIKEQLKKVKLHITYAKNQSIQQLQSKLKTLPRDTIVLLGVYFKDKNGKFFTYEKIGQMIATSSDVPVFCLLKFNIEKGVVGGSVISGYYQGLAMSKIANKILKGIPISKLPILKKGATQFLFDYNGLKKYNMDINKIPKNAIIINKPNSFYERNRVVILISIAIIAFLLIIIMALLISIKKEKMTAKLLLESKNEIDKFNKNLEKTISQRTQELKRQEAKFKYISDNTIEGVIIFEDDKCIDINNAGVKLFNFNSREEALNIDIVNFIADSSKKIAMKHFKMGTATPYEIDVVRADGTIFPALVTGKDATISNKSLRISCVIDLSALKEKEKELQIQTEYLHRFYNNNGIGILLVDKNRKVKKINEKLAKLWGYEPYELIGQNAETFHISKESYEKFGKIAFEQALYKQKINIEYQFKRKNGSLFWAKFSGEKINTNDVLWIITDINQLKEKEEDLTVAKQKAEEDTKLKSEFLANMSHEIRTPMNSIIGMSYLALQTSLNKKQKNYLFNIQNSAENLLNIINDILDFSKIEAGKLTIEKRNFNIKELIKSIKNLVMKKVSEKNLALSIKYSSCTDYICFGDSLRISQILINLIGNAIKFTSKGSIEIKVTRLNESTVRFEVIDTGIGISQEQQNKIFQSFSQADGGITREYGGTGLGLSISKQLVKLMDGKIWTESEPSVGSKFIFEIELKKGDISKIKTPHKTDLNIQSLQGSYILLADDNTINQEIIIGLLENSGINIDIAINGKEAIDMFSKNNYELILMDLQMPIMGGLEATRTIRETDSITPIIALTANAMKEDIDETRNAGMNEHLSKPIEVDRLYEVLLQYISKKVINSENIKKYKDGIHIPTFICIDTNIGLHHTGKNKKLYLKVLNDFCYNYKNLHLEKLNDNELKRVVHTIKGLSASIGAIKLNNISKELEKSFDKKLFKEFYKQLHKVTDELESVKENMDTKTLLKLNTTKKKELFSSLKKYTNKRRSRECKKILEELDKYSLCTKDREILDKINIYLKNRDYRNIKKVLELLHGQSYG